MSIAMARYPIPLSDKEWDWLMNRLSKPPTEEHKKMIKEMADNGRRIKVHS